MRKQKRMNGPLRYARYGRCSSDEMGDKEYSTLDAQEELTLEYVQRAGGIDFNYYVDDGLTGTDLKRKGWRALLADAKKGLFDVVVVTYMSRLGRGDSFKVAEYLLA